MDGILLIGRLIYDMYIFYATTFFGHAIVPILFVVGLVNAVNLDDKQHGVQRRQF